MKYPYSFYSRIALSWTLLVTLIAAVAVSFRNPHIVFMQPLLFVGVGLGQYYLIQLMHEATHQVFLKKGWSGFWVAVWVAFSIGLSRRYTYMHLAHHARFGSEKEDPDYRLYGSFPSSRWLFLSRCFYYLSGVGAIMEYFSRPPGGDHPLERFQIDTLYIVTTQISLWIAIGVATGNIFAYWLFWIAPLITVAKLMGYLRITAEHGHAEQPALHDFSHPNLLDRILSPVGFLRHGLHHQRIKLNFQDLTQADEAPDVETLPHGPTHQLKMLFLQLPWTKGSRHATNRQRWQD